MLMMASTHSDESEEEVCEVDKSLTELSRVFILLLQKHGEERSDILQSSIYGELLSATFAHGMVAV